MLVTIFQFYTIMGVLGIIAMFFEDLVRFIRDRKAWQEDMQFSLDTFGRRGFLTTYGLSVVLAFLFWFVTMPIAFMHILGWPYRKAEK